MLPAGGELLTTMIVLVDVLTLAITFAGLTEPGISELRMRTFAKTIGRLVSVVTRDGLVSMELTGTTVTVGVGATPGPGVTDVGPVSMELTGTGVTVGGSVVGTPGTGLVSIALTGTGVTVTLGISATAGSTGVGPLVMGPTITVVVGTCTGSGLVRAI